MRESLLVCPCQEGDTLRQHWKDGAKGQSCIGCSRRALQKHGLWFGKHCFAECISLMGFQQAQNCPAALTATIIGQVFDKMWRGSLQRNWGVLANVIP